MNLILYEFFLIPLLPTVIGMICGMPGRPIDGYFVPSQAEYQSGSIVKYFCDPRTLMFGSYERVCSENGSWSGDIPVCEKPITVQNAFQSSTLGNFTADKAIDGNLVTYSSTGLYEKGYWTAVLNNQSRVKAIRVTLPAAKIVHFEVTVTNSSSNGVICGSFEGNTETNTTKIFYCPLAVGIRVRIKDKLSDPDFLQLREVEIFIKRDVPCLKPDIPAHGTGRKISDRESIYRYSCDRGYVMKGNDTSTCQDGTWRPQSPKCEVAFCHIPTNFIGGSVKYDENNGVVPFGGFVNYSCNAGYTLKGEPSKQCLGQNIWSQQTPRCVVIKCGNLSFSITNGHLQFNSVTVGSVALLRCNDGYRPWRDDRLECLPNGQWKKSVLRCEAIRCEKPVSVKHGTIEYLDHSNFYGSRIRILCDLGYKPANETLPMCQYDGTWGDLENACVEVTCSPFPVSDMDGGQWIQPNATDVLNVGTVVHLECYPGYEIVGDVQSSVCLPNGSWSRSSSSCIKNVAHPIWSNEWSPGIMMVTSMGIGIGSAICILCLIIGIFLLKKRNQSRNSPPVFHVGIGTVRNTDNRGLLVPTVSNDDNYYSTAIYEEVEQRAPPLPRQRKPCSALPPPPLETDPIYSQPFEEKKDEHGHIYAEPVDACNQQNEENQKKEPQCNRHSYDKNKETNMENNCIYKMANSIAIDMVKNDIYLETR
ncbi:CUB and sushi domain-containing protein 1-like [Centruroides vittatus]|uniref:CUB and sushi domain-containing protein 1-like n=1 Tax=Centruroides vittatus TaxID=120091 RepID=UPI0035106135